MRRLCAVALLFAATVVWGATFVVVKRALVGCAPMTFLALRFLLAAVVLLPLLRGRAVRIARSPTVLLCGLALFAGYALQTWGLARTTPARSAFITAFSIVLVPLLEPAFRVARWSWRALGGAATAVVGLAVLLRPGAAALTAGDWLTTGCAVAFACHGVLLQLAVRRETPATVNAAQVMITMSLAVPAALASGWRVTLTVPTVAALFVTGVLATVGAFWAMAEAQRELSAAETAIVLAFEPVVAGIVSLAAREDTFSPSFALGGAIVVLAVLVTTVKPAASRPLDKTRGKT
jgi:drug/metabolite transporter (DMT)-like permease